MEVLQDVLEEQRGFAVGFYVLGQLIMIDYFNNGKTKIGEY